VLLHADIPPVAVLVALHCPASATEFVSATREIFIGCVKSTPGFVRKVSSHDDILFVWLVNFMSSFVTLHGEDACVYICF